MGTLRDFVSQSDLTGPVALRSWYGEYHPWRRICFHMILCAFATLMRSLVFTSDLDRIPLISPHLNETALKTLKEKHASCIEDLCADARTVVAECPINKGRRSFDLQEHRRHQKSTVLRIPERCIDAMEASMGSRLPPNVPPIVSLDPKIPAILNVDQNCSFYLDNRFFGINVTREGLQFDFTELLAIHKTYRSTLSLASLVCEDYQSLEFQSDIPYLLETYNWLLSSEGRYLLRSILKATLVGMVIIGTTLQTMFNTAIFMVSLIPLAVVLQMISPSKPPLRLWDILLSLVLLALLTTPLEPLDSDSAKRDLAFRSITLMVTAVSLRKFRIAFEWWFLMMFQLAWEGGIPILDDCLLFLSHWPHVGPIMSPLIRFLLWKDMRKIVVPLGCAIYRTFPRPETS